MMKGRGGSAIFKDDGDGKTFETLVSDGLDRFGHAVHAYCWMPNHVHMVIEVGDIGLPRIMQNLGTRYTRYINDKYGRQGPLFQGRYQAVPVDVDGYLLPLVRYVHRNPVDGGLCQGAHRYRWSSHRAYLKLDEKSWLETRRVYSLLGPDEESAVEAYRDFMAWPGEGRSARAMDAGLEEGILGDADFRDRINRQQKRTIHAGRDGLGAVTLEAVISAVAGAYAITPEAMAAPGRDRTRSEARNMVGYLSMERDVATLGQVAAYFGRDLSTLSRGVERLRSRFEGDRPLHAKLAAVEAGLWPE
jgi:REP element-mobilizing transposase RayT